MTPTLNDKIEGLLLGTAVGDTLGLPAEGIGPEMIKRLKWNQPWKQRLILGRGMWSDDTEHTIMLSQALLASEGDIDFFTKQFAWELRWWVVGLPAGIGFATLRAILKLWLGISPHHSGVFSAGNGPCMRTSIIGACYHDDAARRRELVSAQTQITHTDPKALIATLAVTELAAMLAISTAAPSKKAVLSCLSGLSDNHSWQEIISKMSESWDREATLAEYTESIGCSVRKGISGYAYHTVPAVIYSGVLHEWNFVAVVNDILCAGGDTDSTAAIAGALCGVFGGRQCIPSHWIDRISECPTRVSDLSRLAAALSHRTPIRIRPYWAPTLFLRNIFFIFAVLCHGLSRILPPFIRRKIIS